MVGEKLCPQTSFQVIFIERSRNDTSVGDAFGSGECDFELIWATQSFP
ncbi:MAG: hypothetical protein ABJ314_05385 [Ilumatobacter sp.]